MLKKFWEICNNLKKFTDKPHSLKRSKGFKKVFIATIQHLIHTAYKICVNLLFLLLERLPVNSQPLEIKFTGSPKLCANFDHVWDAGQCPYSCIVQGSIVFWTALDTMMVYTVNINLDLPNICFFVALRSSCISELSSGIIFSLPKEYHLIFPFLQFADDIFS